MRRSKATSTSERAALPHSTQYRFIGGKGGVGKTTCAAGLAIVSAARGSRTLLISTDPAPSLGDALRQRLTARPRPVRGVPRLHAMEVDAPAALAEYLAERRGTLEEIAVRGSWLDREDVSRLLQLSLPGIDEVAGLLQIASVSRHGPYDLIVVDAAPTGHLLRMLEMPAILDAVAHLFNHMQEKHRIVVESLRGSYRGDAADALVEEIGADAAHLSAWFRDPQRTRVSWVTLAEGMSVEEASDALLWLDAQGISVDTVILNRLTTEPRERCRWCAARRNTERRAIELLRTRTRRGIRLAAVPAAGGEPRGVRALEKIGRAIVRGAAPRGRSARSASSPRRRLAAIPPVVAEMPAIRLAGEVPALADDAVQLVLFGGKGGVGKTTCAAAAALDLAVSNPGARVLLISVDPAHSVGDVLGQAIGDSAQPVRGAPSNLFVRELDAARASAALRGRLRRAVDQLFGAGARADGAAQERQALRDLLDLAPPGIDELVAVLDVTGSLEERSAPFDVVVMDTAPTGHALRLIEMPALAHGWVRALMALLLKYQQVVRPGELGAILVRLSRALVRVRELMTDPARTSFVVVARAAALPRVETARLLERLASASVDAPVLIANALGAGTCRRCRRERSAQGRELRALVRILRSRPSRPRRVVAAAAKMPPPHGPGALLEWRRAWQRVYPQPA